MQLLPTELRVLLPKLHAQAEAVDPIVHVKFFTPDSNWTWFLLEFDGNDECFGLVIGFEEEFGYFLLSELESLRGPFGLPIERDLYFTPQPLSVARKTVPGASH